MSDYMRDEADNSEKKPSRRSILKNVAAGTALLGIIGTPNVGATTIASDEATKPAVDRGSDTIAQLSETDRATIEERYATRETVRTAIENADTIRSTLSEKDILHDSQLPALEPTDLEPLARKRGSAGAAVQPVAAGDGTTYRVSVVAQTGHNAVQLFLYPETGRRYAIVERPTSSLFVIEDDDTVEVNALQDRSASTNSVTPQACHQSGYICGNGCPTPQVMLYEYLWCEVANRCAVGAQVGCAPRRYYDCKTC